jgi:16S rRNA processing protein RimM
MPENQVVVGKVRTAHGLLGSVKIESFTKNPNDIFNLTPFYVKDVEFTSWNRIQKTSSPHVFIVALAQDREGALAYREEYVTVCRSILPADEDDIYYVDLIGQSLYTPCGNLMGHVKDFYNFGAGDILEIETPHQKRLMLSLEDITISKESPLTYTGDASLIAKYFRL